MQAKRLLALFAILAAVTLFSGCEDEAEKDKDAITSRVNQIVGYVRTNNFSGFDALKHPDSQQVDTYGSSNFSNWCSSFGGSSFTLSGISASDSGVATATDQLGESHSFTFKKDGDDWMLYVWKAGSDTVYNKGLNPKW